MLDNSVALAWCFEDEQSPTVMELLDRLVETGATAPLLWPLEALNALFMAERRRRIDRAKRKMLAAFLQELPVVLDAETAARTWDATAVFAGRFDLTVYDAAYLELAERRRLPLASLDKKLRAAAQTMKIEILA